MAALMVESPLHLVVISWADCERARREARRLARSIGFDPADAESVALATSELATNLVRYTNGGEIWLSAVDGAHYRGIEVASHDRGPGIADLGQAMQDGFSTSGGLGSGLPSVQRLMDELEVTSGPAGTTLVARRWPRRR